MEKMAYAVGKDHIKIQNQGIWCTSNSLDRNFIKKDDKKEERFIVILKIITKMVYNALRHSQEDMVTFQTYEEKNRQT